MIDDTSRYVRCQSCGYRMVGIYSDTIREVCSPCGGRAICENDPEHEQWVAEVRMRSRIRRREGR